MILSLFARKHKYTLSTIEFHLHEYYFYAEKKLEYVHNIGKSLQKFLSVESFVWRNWWKKNFFTNTNFLLETSKFQYCQEQKTEKWEYVKHNSWFMLILWFLCWCYILRRKKNYRWKFMLFKCKILTFLIILICCVVEISTICSFYSWQYKFFLDTEKVLSILQKLELILSQGGKWFHKTSLKLS